jgi:hypothetical protein
MPILLKRFGTVLNRFNKIGISALLPLNLLALKPRLGNEVLRSADFV